MKGGSGDWREQLCDELMGHPVQQIMMERKHPKKADAMVVCQCGSLLLSSSTKPSTNVDKRLC